MKLLKSSCLSLAFGLLSISLSAQEKSESPLGLSVTLKNAHVWRGIEVTNSLLINSSLKISTFDDALSVGVAGNTTVEGTFKEFNHFISFEKSGFSIALWDIFNYSDGNASDYNITDAYNYNASETGRFMDLELAYKLSDAFPLTISYNTIIFGRDRGVIDKKGNIGNRYSSFVHASYPIIKDTKLDLDFGVGGAFAYRNVSGSEKNFYGDTYGIVHINLNAHKDIIIGKYEIPFLFEAIWNPKSKKSHFVISLDIIRF